MSRCEKFAWAMVVFGWLGWYCTLFKLTSARHTISVYEEGLKLKGREAMLEQELRDAARNDE